MDDLEWMRVQSDACARAALLVAVLAMCSCQGGASNSGGSAPPASETAAAIAVVPSAPGSADANVASVVNASDKAPVAVSGLYLGWQGPCAGAPPTRSAWQLADSAQAGSACVYVDGPLLRGVSPTAAAAGVRVRVQGVVHAEGSGRYIEAQKVDRL